MEALAKQLCTQRQSQWLLDTLGATLLPGYDLRYSQMISNVSWQHEPPKRPSWKSLTHNLAKVPCFVISRRQGLGRPYVGFQWVPVDTKLSACICLWFPNHTPSPSLGLIQFHQFPYWWTIRHAFYGSMASKKWTDSTVYTGLQHKQIQYSAMFWRGVDCMETGNKLVNIYIYKCSLYASIHPSIHPSIHLSSAYHIYIRVFVCAQWIVHKCS